MVKIRLMRVGKTKQPSYRVVVADSRSPRDGRIIEAIGHYQPRQNPSVVSIDTERADYWLSVGAQPSDQVKRLLEIARSGGGAPEAEAPKPTRARAVKATPAASVSDDAPSDEAGPGEVSELPEAVDQTPAAPEAAASDVQDPS